jgi:hypothetical protein
MSFHSFEYKTQAGDRFLVEFETDGNCEIENLNVFPCGSDIEIFDYLDSGIQRKIMYQAQDSVFRELPEKEDA